jgi:tetratricopeptide (TPR) repeat protein
MRGSSKLLRSLVWLLATVAWSASVADAPGAAPRPGGFVPEEVRKAAELQTQLTQSQEAGKLDQALKAAEALLALHENNQGRDHWEAATARWEVDALRRALAQGAEARRDYARLSIDEKQARALLARGSYREAQLLLEKALASCRRILGPEHPQTAVHGILLGESLVGLGRYREAAEIYLRSLETHRKTLGDDHPVTALSYCQVAWHFTQLDRDDEAEQRYRTALLVQRKCLGDEHADTLHTRAGLASILYLRGRYRESEEEYRRILVLLGKVLGAEHAETALTSAALGDVLVARRKFKEAIETIRTALTVQRKLLGEEHPDTLKSYSRLAHALHEDRQFAEEEKLARKVLAVRKKVLGDAHPDVAQSCIDVAEALHGRQQFREAEEYVRNALDIRQKRLGEEYRATHASYDSVAWVLDAQNRYDEAAHFYRKALDTRRKLLGEEHASTAASCRNMGYILATLGNYDEAEEFDRKSLEIRLKVLGEMHGDTAESYANLAWDVEARGKYREANELLGKALAVRRKVLGEDDPATARLYGEMASNLRRLGRLDQAEALASKALARTVAACGEINEDTASAYFEVAKCRQALGREEEAEKGFRKALDIEREVVGPEDSNTVLYRFVLASSLRAQGRYAEAGALFTEGADLFLATRTRFASSGLGRATRTSEDSPLRDLAAILARNGKPEQAWLRFEQGLGRGTWDDVTARLRRPAAEQVRLADFTGRLEQIDRMLKDAVAGGTTPTNQRRREELLDHRIRAQDELSTFIARLEKTYGRAAGEIADQRRIQGALRDDEALVGWIDIPPHQPTSANRDGEHWAVLLRSRGAPVWVRLPGTGLLGAWQQSDGSLPERLRKALEEREGDWRTLAEELGAQRLAPLKPYLAGGNGKPPVRHLVVLPSDAVSDVPVEIFAEGYTVRYALSGTLFTHLRDRPRATTQGLLAVGDPVFRSRPVAEEWPLPDHGVLILRVVKGSNAERARINTYDVLLSYGGKELRCREDLVVASEEPGVSVPFEVWDRGHVYDGSVWSGKLGVVLSHKPLLQALDAVGYPHHKPPQDGHAQQVRPLPETRVEVEGLGSLFGDKKARLLLGSQASQQELHRLARSDELARFRYIHLSTHGDVDFRSQMGSALLLSQNKLPDPRKQLEKGLPVFEGRLTAEEVLRRWRLDCELVTLSACNTGLGKYEVGEGYVGFPQAFILAGSRTVCVSLWPVDDRAATLLMVRFYENLLGKRPGLKAPMPKAEALADAKRWLRELSAEDLFQRTVSLSPGAVRSLRQPKLATDPDASARVTEDRPYAHPYYWAAFVLIGDAR